MRCSEYQGMSLALIAIRFLIGGPSRLYVVIRKHALDEHAVAVVLQVARIRPGQIELAHLRRPSIGSLTQTSHAR